MYPDPLFCFTVHFANFNYHLPTLPNYDINIYDKVVKIEAPTLLQVIMITCEFKLDPDNFNFSCFKG